MVDSVGGSPGVRGRGFVIKDSGTVAAVLSMIQAVNVCGGAVVDSVGGSPGVRGRGFVIKDSGTVAAVPWSVRLMIPGVAWSLSRWIL